MSATVVTVTGRALLTQALQSGTITAPKFLQWGLNTGTFVAGSNNANTPNGQASDVALFAPVTSGTPETRATGTTSVATTNTNVIGDSWVVTGTITASGSTRVIGEVGLFDAVTLPPTTTITTGTTGVTGSATNTLLYLTSATGFPTSGIYYVQIRNEVMRITAGAGSTTLTVARGALGTTALTTIVAGDPVTPGAGYTAAGTATTQAGGTALTNMFLHADFAAVTLNASDSIQFTITTTFT